jgi:hypothetical protein
MAFGVDDTPCNRAASLEDKVELFDFLAFENADQCLPLYVPESPDDQKLVGQDVDAIDSRRNPGDLIPALLIGDGSKRFLSASLNGPSLREKLNRDAAQRPPVQNNPSRDGRCSLFFVVGLRLGRGALSQAREAHQKQER